MRRCSPSTPLNTLRLADRDGLTGLYNRRRLSELLREAIQDAAPPPL
jgi:GGDEF domain-containing protein